MVAVGRRFPSWPHHDTRGPVAREACYTRCTACDAKLYAIVEVVELRIERVIVRLERDWPDGYFR
jgi:hypothetical protein